MSSLGKLLNRFSRVKFLTMKQLIYFKKKHNFKWHQVVAYTCNNYFNNIIKNLVTLTNKNFPKEKTTGFCVAPFRKKLITSLSTKYLAFVDITYFFCATSTFCCWHETLFRSISTYFCRHQMTFCATSNILFRHKIIFPATPNFCYGHRSEC